MARVVMVLNDPVLTFADDQLGLDTSPEYQCQVTAARIVGSPNYNTIPSTGCAGASQSPGLTSFALEVAWLQDWTSPGGGLSGYADDNDGERKWFRFQPSSTDATVKAEGEVFITAGSFGGTFGDGSAAVTDTTSWPCPNKPTITKPAPAGLAAEADTEAA